MSELMVIKQLPIIEERLKTLSDEIDSKLSVALALDCSEDTVKEIKNIRSELNKEKTFYEDGRKTIKNAVMAPYEDFEKSYKIFVKDKFDFADAELKRKIDDVENSLKEKKRIEVEIYFNEYLQSKNIDFITFEQANINITLSASMKGLKEQAKTFIDRIGDDLALIDTQEHKTEILVEYKRNLNVSAAITTVSNRHIAIKREQEKAVETEVIKETETQVVQKVESFTAPVVNESVKTLTFKITDTIPRLRELKKFLDDGGYKYE